MWIIVHIILVFVCWPLLFLTIPLHVISSIKKDNAKTRAYIERQQKQQGK